MSFACIQRHGLTLIANELYIFGGLYHSKYQQTLYKLTEDKEVLNIDDTSGELPENRAGHA